MKKPSVIVGMSGGVDSCVAAAMLVEQGYKVHGVTLKVWEHADESTTTKRWQERSCCKVGIAKYAAKLLGISHEVLDTRSDFKSAVIDDFVEGYLGGSTPNPCVRCNERVKLRSLYALAQARSVDFVATGHYARIEHASGRSTLHQALDRRKDQSYFLYRIAPAWLPKLLFPVGSLEKHEVWTRAESMGLPAEELKESQEICFVTQGDYRTFLEMEAPHSKRPGNFENSEGQVLGRHEGIAYYTPGQRRGLGIATGERLYVQRVVPQTNTVVIGPEDGLFASECTVADLNLFEETLLTGSAHADVKFRYATPAVPALLKPQADGTIQIAFQTPQRTLSPGQSAVFYKGDHVLGGGIIQPSFG